MINWVFDVDGVLSNVGVPAPEAFKDWFLNWSQGRTYYLISGGRREKTIYQVGADIVAGAQAVYCCIGNSLVVVTPELGVRVGDHVAVGVAARLGVPLGANIDGPDGKSSTLAPAVLLRWTLLAALAAAVAVWFMGGRTRDARARRAWTLAPLAALWPGDAARGRALVDGELVLGGEVEGLDLERLPVGLLSLSYTTLQLQYVA